MWIYYEWPWSDGICLHYILISKRKRSHTLVRHYECPTFSIVKIRTKMIVITSNWKMLVSLALHYNNAVPLSAAVQSSRHRGRCQSAIIVIGSLLLPLVGGTCLADSTEISAHVLPNYNVIPNPTLYIYICIMLSTNR